MRRWMAARASRVADIADPRARDPEMVAHWATLRQWARDHGTGGGSGPVRIRWRPGPVRSAAYAACRLQDGDLTWFSFGGAGVWGYEPARDRHFLLYLPASYHPGEGLVLGRRYLWMGEGLPADSGAALIAYDRQARRFTAFAMPASHHSWLSFSSGRLMADSVPLALPDSVARTEFGDGATECASP
jgi:hypothetical protein